MWHQQPRMPESKQSLANPILSQQISKTTRACPRTLRHRHLLPINRQRNVCSSRRARCKCSTTWEKASSEFTESRKPTHDAAAPCACEVEGATTPSIPVDAGLDTEETSRSMARVGGINYERSLDKQRAGDVSLRAGGGDVVLLLVVACDDHRTDLDTLSGGDGKCRSS